MGEATVADFMRLYTAPGVDHVGSGGPSNVDMLSVLVDWVENGRAPEDLTVVEQQAVLPIAVDRSLPLCQWPARPHYKAGDSRSAASFVCAPRGSREASILLQSDASTRRHLYSRVSIPRARITGPLHPVLRHAVMSAIRSLSGGK